MWKRRPDHGHADERSEEDATRDDRQRHGGRAHARRAAEDRARSVRHHRLRRRTPPQLQPHPAVAGACRRTDAGRNRAQRLGLVPGARHHAARRLDRHPRGPCAPRGARRERRRRDDERRVRPPAAGRGLQPVHPADPGQGPGGRDRLPGHRRHPRDDRSERKIPTRRGHRRRPARAGSGQRPDEARHAGQRGACHAHADGARSRASCCRSLWKNAACASCWVVRRRR